MPETGAKIKYMVLIRNYSITDGVSQTQCWRLEISRLASKNQADSHQITHRPDKTVYTWTWPSHFHPQGAP